MQTALTHGRERPIGCCGSGKGRVGHLTYPFWHNSFYFVGQPLGTLSNKNRRAEAAGGGDDGFVLGRMEGNPAGASLRFRVKFWVTGY